MPAEHWSRADFNSPAGQVGPSELLGGRRWHLGSWVLTIESSDERCGEDEEKRSREAAGDAEDRVSYGPPERGVDELSERREGYPTTKPAAPRRRAGLRQNDRARVTPTASADASDPRWPRGVLLHYFLQYTTRLQSCQPPQISVVHPMLRRRNAGCNDCLLGQVQDEYPALAL